MLTRQTELNIFKKKSEALLRVVPVALAGGGPVTQTIQIDEWFNILNKKYTIPVRRLGVKSPRSEFVNENFTGKIYSLDQEIETSASIKGIYKNVTDAVVREVEYLYSNGIRHITGVCCGYTSYGPFAFQRALKKVNLSNKNDILTANLMIQDSSFPDTDNLSESLDIDGYPMTRFYGPAYQSNSWLKIVFTLNAVVPFDVTLSKRIPQGCTPLLASFPFTKTYISKWQKKMSKSDAMEQLNGVIPSWEKITHNDLIIPFLSSDIWDPSFIGKWMTQQQFNTVVEGTLNFVKALSYVSKVTKKNVFLPIIKNAEKFILSQNMSDVYPMNAYEVSMKKRAVYIMPYNVIPQHLFINLIAASDIVVNRSTQSNSFIETIMTDTAQLVSIIPAADYMDGELMAMNLKHGLIAYNWPSEKIGMEIEKIITDNTYKNDLIGKFKQMLIKMNEDQKTNFGSILTEVSGLID